MAELEAAVGQSLAPVEALGGPHRVLRAFRPLLFADTRTLAGSPLLGALPPAVVLSHLFSRAPPALQSPHERSGFTPAQARARQGLELGCGCEGCCTSAELSVAACTCCPAVATPALRVTPAQTHAFQAYN